MVEIKNLSAGYNGQPVIRIPSLSFGEGEITSIIGENGSGKSTLLKTIDNILRYNGSIKADGKEIAGLRHLERARLVAYLPQTLIPVRLNVRTLVFLGYLPGRINDNFDIMGLRDRYFSFMDQNKYL